MYRKRMQAARAGLQALAELLLPAKAPAGEAPAPWDVLVPR